MCCKASIVHVSMKYKGDDSAGTEMVQLTLVDLLFAGGIVRCSRYYVVPRSKVRASDAGPKFERDHVRRARFRNPGAPEPSLLNSECPLVIA